MLKIWLFHLKKISKRLSVRAALFALLAVTSSLVGVFLRDYVPDELADLAGGPAVDGILSIMASSMLLVVTFSIATMLSAYSVATQVATPRATELIIDDSKSHSSISVFLGEVVWPQGYSGI